MLVEWVRGYDTRDDEFSRRRHRELFDRFSGDKQEHVQQVYYVTGQVDLVAIITARDVEHYDDISAQLMAENPQIREAISRSRRAA